MADIFPESEVVADDESSEDDDSSESSDSEPESSSRSSAAQMIKAPGTSLLRCQKVPFEVAEKQVEKPAELEAEAAIVDVVPAQPHKYFRTLLLGLAGLSLVQLQLEVGKGERQSKKKTTIKPVYLTSKKVEEIENAVKDEENRLDLVCKEALLSDHS